MDEKINVRRGTASHISIQRPINEMQTISFQMEYLPSPRGEIQVISARKPAADASHSDPDQRMAELERDIKREMLRQTLVQTGKTPTKEDLELLKE